MRFGAGCSRGLTRLTNVTQIEKERNFNQEFLQCFGGTDSSRDFEFMDFVYCLHSDTSHQGQNHIERWSRYTFDIIILPMFPLFVEHIHSVLDHSIEVKVSAQRSHSAPLHT